MNKDFINTERSPSVFVRWGAMTFGVAFIICFLFIVSILGFFYPHSYFQKIMLMFFLALAVIGVAALILIGMGVLKYDATQLHGNFGFSIFDSTDDAIIVSDLSGFVYYSNQSYRNILTYRPESSCYAVISDLPGAGALLYRLKVAACSNLAAQEELRIERPIFLHSVQSNSAWYNISVQPIIKRRKKLLFWRIADISHLQKYHEVFFSHLQESIHHLTKLLLVFYLLIHKG